jgi:hypothetical protein
MGNERDPAQTLFRPSIITHIAMSTKFEAIVLDAACCVEWAYQLYSMLSHGLNPELDLLVKVAD